jgi:hypothetical protein
MEDGARRVRRMVETEEPTLDVLSALCLLRADVRSFEMLMLQARLQQLAHIVGSGTDAQPATMELLGSIGRELRYFIKELGSGRGRRAA